MITDIIMNRLLVIGILVAAAVLIPVAAFAIIENEAQLLVDAGMEQFEIAIKADILQEGHSAKDRRL